MRRFVSRGLVWCGILTTGLLAVSLISVSRRIEGDERFVPTTIRTPDGLVTMLAERHPGEAFAAKVEMLAGEMPDAAETEKTSQLREKLRTVIDAKAALLNSAALEAEIAQHERQIMELKALAELQDAHRKLQDVSDKYPDSDTGRQAQELLDVIRQQDEKSIPIRSRSRYREAFEAPESLVPNVEGAQEFGPEPGT